MKTDRLIATLAASAGPVRLQQVRRRFALTLAGGLLIVLLLPLVILGVRPDIESAMRLPVFWWKLVFPAGVAIPAAIALSRLARPGVRLGRPLWAVVGLFLVAWTLGAAAWMAATPAERAFLLFGNSAIMCVQLIALLSVPAAAAAMIALRAMAPTRPVLAGAVAGLFAGGCAAAAYALHCDEMALPFVAVWYSLGVLVPAALGAFGAGRLLRW